MNYLVGEEEDQLLGHGVAHIISRVKEEGRKALLAPEAEMICANYGIPIVDSFVATTKKEACKKAEETGFPLVLKIVSHDILHKTEAGGVLVGIQNQDELRKGYERIIANAKNHSPNAKILGVLIQRMAQPGVEVIVGGLRDIQFGPTVSFGVGGIFTEILKDAVFGLVPLDESEAVDMIHSIKAYPLLTGFRNLPRVNEKTITSIMLKVSRLLSDYAEIDQIDLNPTIASDEASTVVDARILLRP